MSLVTNTVSEKQSIVIDNFCIRQFNNNDFPGTQIFYDVKEFENQINILFNSGQFPMVDGYAPFCKHLFIPNFAGVKCGYVKIDDIDQRKIKSGYESRRSNELPVLTQWVDRDDVEAPAASILDIILYSRDQINLENSAMDTENSVVDAPWGIVSVKGQTVGFELPMQPITMMRNALGIDQGGSGVQLDEKSYRASVEFWKNYVSIK